MNNKKYIRKKYITCSRCGRNKSIMHMNYAVDAICPLIEYKKINQLYSNSTNIKLVHKI
jgi:hypothetical protein